MRRRDFLLSAAALASAPVHAAVERGPDYPVVTPGVPLVFPRDFGAHPLFRTEWWYVTGWLERAGKPLGMQLTFFRIRPRVDEENASRFAPRQLLFAHAALADPQLRRLRHDQRAARAGFGIAEAALDTTRVHIGDWSLERVGDTYRARIAARDFRCDLVCRVTQPLLLQGDEGYSRKGPHPRQASYYYSEPQLAVEGRVAIDGAVGGVTGTAWCDHEWSSEIMTSDAAGWDWAGLNLEGGAALMAFVMRDRDGRPLWAAATHRDAAGRRRVLGPREVRFAPLRRWVSGRSNAAYPVATEVLVGERILRLEPLFDDQEQDVRASMGMFYWEGAVRAHEHGREVGRGYLELTGYAGQLRL